MNALAGLDARSFHAHLEGLLRTEFVSQGAFLAALAEFDRRGSFRDLGYASLFDYLHRGLKLSRGAAHHRRAAAWLVGRFPEVLESIQDGRLCFTTSSILASVLTDENREDVLPRFYGLSKQEALEVAAELKPRKVVPERTVVTQVEAVETAERNEPAEPLASWTDASQKVHPGELDAPPPVVVPMTATASRLHITVSREFIALLKRAKAGESHRTPGATDEEVLRAGLEALLEKQSKRKACVPANVKREVVRRDEGKCTWPLADGGTCGATIRLQVDHVVPRGKGGPSTVENCRILCQSPELSPRSAEEWGGRSIG
jgi:HNH endonuclease